MDITGIFKAILSYDQEQTSGRFEGLRPGESLTGKVLRVEADGRLLIDLGRFRALAQVNIPAQPGQRLNLKVETVGDPIHFRLQQHADASAARPVPEMAPTLIFKPAELQLVAKTIARLVGRVPLSAQAQTMADSGKPVAVEPFSDLFNSRGDVAAVGVVKSAMQSNSAVRPIEQSLMQLGILLARPSIDAPVQQWVKVLRTHLEDNGHLFEARLAHVLESAHQGGEKVAELALQGILRHDLKPQLLTLRSFLSASDDQVAAALAQGADAQEVAMLRQAVDRLLGHIEQQQQRGIQRSGDGDTYQVFAHLLPVKENAESVRIKIYYPRKRLGGQEREPHRIALLLTMDRLGSVRADISMVGRLLSVRFFVEDQSVCDIFDQHTHLIDDLLAGYFEQVDVAAFVSREKIDQFEGEDLTGVPVGKVDVTI